MNSSNRFLQKTINLEGRSFSLQTLGFENGYFISVSEGSNKIGSTVVSLGIGPMPITTTVIPSKSEGLFLKLMAERISTRVKGIAVISSFVQKELEPNVTKALMTEIMELIQS